MSGRYASLWFSRLLTDWAARRHPEIAARPFAICDSDRGRVFIRHCNAPASELGIVPGMTLADARALVPSLEKMDFEEGRAEEILAGMADWCLRYTPCVSIDPPDSLLLDISGCAHLMGGEAPMLKDMLKRFRGFGYGIRGAMADTAGAAWAAAHHEKRSSIIAPGSVRESIARLPPAALRLDVESIDTLRQFGITKISQLYDLPRAALTRRFRTALCLRLDQALGLMGENLPLRRPVPLFTERIESQEGILTGEGVAIALRRLLEAMRLKLEQNGKGVRTAIFTAFRTDGVAQSVEIGTSRPSRDPGHLFRLFQERLDRIDPGLGLELFTLDAPHVDFMEADQSAMLGDGASDTAELAALVDRLAIRLGKDSVYALAPFESYLPERGSKKVPAGAAQNSSSWLPRERPIHILKKPQVIEVMAPVPDYPPMLFRHNGALHRIRRADGPERIEPEWWGGGGKMRDYYRLEDMEGVRFWVFRAGAYHPDNASAWYLHGYFA